jgi:hypothetical protein
MQISIILRIIPSDFGRDDAEQGPGKRFYLDKPTVPIYFTGLASCSYFK